MLADAATVVVDTVASRRATFTRSNVLAEALRQLHGIRFTTPRSGPLRPSAWPCWPWMDPCN